MRGHRGGEAACPRATAAAGDADAPAAAPPSGRSQARSSSSYSDITPRRPARNPFRARPITDRTAKAEKPPDQSHRPGRPRHPPPPRQAGAAGDRSRQAAPGTPRSASEPSARVRQRTPSTHPTAPAAHPIARPTTHPCGMPHGARAGAGPAGPVCVRPRRLPASSPRPSPRRGGRRGRAGRPGSRVRGGAGFSVASRPNRPPLPGRCPPRYSDGPASHAPPSLPRTPFPAPSLFLLRGSPGGFPGTVAKNRPPGIFWRRPHPWTVRPAPAERVPGPRRTKPQEAVRGPRGRQKQEGKEKGAAGETPCRAAHDRARHRAPCGA